MYQQKNKIPKTPKFKRKDSNKKRSREVVIGCFLMLFSVFLIIAVSSFFNYWKDDQSTLAAFAQRDIQSENILNKFGAMIGHLLVYKSMGLGAYIFIYLLIVTGLVYFIGKKKKNILSQWTWGFFYILWTAITIAFFWEQNPIFSGVIGYEINDFLNDYIGKIGTGIFLLFVTIYFLVYHWKLVPENLVPYLKKIKFNFPSKKETLPVEKKEKSVVFESPIKPPSPIKDTTKEVEKKAKEEDISIQIETITEEEKIEKLSAKAVEKHGDFDPTLELKSFMTPKYDLLKEYPQEETITINEEELDVNKDNIVGTLENYGIKIVHIQATIGPTVTLYEIIPEAGIRISKIKNLEDDIALSLSALGIRIIAPIPGKGTIGIEVPNQKPSIVSMYSVIMSKKFQMADMELPIALGKTISNETFVVDLAKMPHLLMAGATGQGKSVGINVILTSLLYKKHPAEIKFVLVDPKKVELSIYNKIERHYLAKLPDSEESIITDNKKVINTLNSLCIEMDNRYELLKNAGCRNLKEYNQKFKSRKLNPNNDHKYLPYIVLVVDEFADLIMTAGKEVEMPIARLAQLARAVGIHLIIATQRPSVNVITGVIKANFPARIAFRVTSKIDSRTILDNNGADQLIGRGDMLYTQGNDLIRIQCAFVDTPEVNEIVDYIGAQTGYSDAYILPEYKGEESEALEDDPNQRDELFREAAEILVTAQQGSTSLIQRKLKLGYNRAGRIMDQLEAAGIVGPFEGSKARKVLITDLVHLDQFLKG